MRTCSSRGSAPRRTLLEARDGAGRMAGARVRVRAAPVRSSTGSPPDVESLVLVPDGVLHRLPFDALSSGPRAPYLAERFRVSVAPRPPSGSSSARPRRSVPVRPWCWPTPAGDRICPREAVSAGTGAGDARVRGAPPFPGRGPRGDLAAFPRANELRTGVAASGGLREVRRSSSLFHAPHTSPPTPWPRSSTTPGGRRGGASPRGLARDQGRIRAEDLAAAAPGRTVVLAGCGPRPGTVRRGEGVMSLARAFFSAGAVSVVGTLEPRPDDETAAFFTERLPGPGAGGSIGEAVADAKRQRLVSAGRPRLAWADVVLLETPWPRPGEWRPGPSRVVACERSGHRLRRGGASLWLRHFTTSVRKRARSVVHWRAGKRGVGLQPGCRLRGPGGGSDATFPVNLPGVVPGDPRWLNSGRPGLKVGYVAEHPARSGRPTRAP